MVEKDWITAAGLRAVCYIASLGGHQHHRNGYVLVPRQHPLFGMDYNYVDAAVHGGLTYSSAANGYPVESEEGTWFGFDCAHFNDGIIDTSGPFNKWNLGGGEAKTLEFVVHECEHLAAQFATYKTTLVQ